MNGVNAMRKASFNTSPVIRLSMAPNGWRPIRLNCFDAVLMNHSASNGRDTNCFNPRPLVASRIWALSQAAIEAERAIHAAVERAYFGTTLTWPVAGL